MTPPALEPAVLGERAAAQFIAVSPRLLRHLVDRGDITQIRIPGVRRVVFDVAELRALVARWKAGRAS